MASLLACQSFKSTGEMLTNIITWDVAEETFSSALRSAFAAAQNTSLKLDMGGILRTVIETSTFQLHVFTFGHLTFFLMVTPKAKGQVVEASINDFIDKELYAA